MSNWARERLVGWASYFAEFNIWMPGMPSGRLRNVPGCNVSFKRWILDRVSPHDEGIWGEDTAYNWRLRQAGHQPLFEPACVAVSVPLSRPPT